MTIQYYCPLCRRPGSGNMNVCKTCQAENVVFLDRLRKALGLGPMPGPAMFAILLKRLLQAPKKPLWKRAARDQRRTNVDIR